MECSFIPYQVPAGTHQMSSQCQISDGRGQFHHLHGNNRKVAEFTSTEYIIIIWWIYKAFAASWPHPLGRKFGLRCQRTQSILFTDLFSGQTSFSIFLFLLLFLCFPHFSFCFSCFFFTFLLQPKNLPFNLQIFSISPHHTTILTTIMKICCQSLLPVPNWHIFPCAMFSGKLFSARYLRVRTIIFVY